MATIQDVEKAADALGQAIHSFDDADNKAKADRTAADGADAVATASESAAGLSKQNMIDAHTAFDAVLDSFLHPVPNP